MVSKIVTIWKNTTPLKVNELKYEGKPLCLLVSKPNT